MALALFHQGIEAAETRKSSRFRVNAPQLSAAPRLETSREVRVWRRIAAPDVSADYCSLVCAVHSGPANNLEELRWILSSPQSHIPLEHGPPPEHEGPGCPPAIEQLNHV